MHSHFFYFLSFILFSVLQKVFELSNWAFHCRHLSFTHTHNPKQKLCLYPIFHFATEWSLPFSFFAVKKNVKEIKQKKKNRLNFCIVHVFTLRYCRRENTLVNVCVSTASKEICDKKEKFVESSRHSCW